MHPSGNILIFCLVLISACQKPDVPKPVLTLTQQRLMIYRAEQDSICKTKARHLAELAVDSLFLTLTQRYLLDSISIPQKPIKPTIDTSIILDNTTPVKPLWDTLK